MSAEKGKSSLPIGIILAVLLGIVAVFATVMYQNLEWEEQEVTLPPALKC